MAQLLATKRSMTQMWTKSGKRMPVTVLAIERNVLLETKESGKSLIGYGEKRLKNTKKPLMGLLKKSNVEKGVKSIKELTTSIEGKTAGMEIKPSEVFTIGDIVDVTGISKGSGYTGVMKLHGFHGGPKTHGQSDRARSPGSIGAGTTPGRVYKNKRMAGRGGSDVVTVENLRIVSVNDETMEVLVKGLVPGTINGQVTITKVSSDSKFEGMFAKEIKVETTVQPEVVETVKEEVSEVKTEEGQA